MANEDDLITEKIEKIENKDIKLLAEIQYLSAKLLEQVILESIYPVLRIPKS